MNSLVLQNKFVSAGHLKPSMNSQKYESANSLGQEVPTEFKQTSSLWYPVGSKYLRLRHFDH